MRRRAVKTPNRTHTATSATAPATPAPTNTPFRTPFVESDAAAAIPPFKAERDCVSDGLWVDEALGDCDGESDDASLALGVILSERVSLDDCEGDADSLGDNDGERDEDGEELDDGVTAGDGVTDCVWLGDPLLLSVQLPVCVALRESD